MFLDPQELTSIQETLDRMPLHKFYPSVYKNTSYKLSKVLTPETTFSDPYILGPLKGQQLSVKRITERLRSKWENDITNLRLSLYPQNAKTSAYIGYAKSLLIKLKRLMMTTGTDVMQKWYAVDAGTRIFIQSIAGVGDHIAIISKEYHGGLFLYFPLSDRFLTFDVKRRANGTYELSNNNKLVHPVKLASTILSGSWGYVDSEYYDFLKHQIVTGGLDNIRGYFNHGSSGWYTPKDFEPSSALGWSGDLSGAVGLYNLILGTPPTTLTELPLIKFAACSGRHPFTYADKSLEYSNIALWQVKSGASNTGVITTTSPASVDDWVRIGGCYTGYQGYFPLDREHTNYVLSLLGSLRRSSGIKYGEWWLTYYNSLTDPRIWHREDFPVSPSSISFVTTNTTIETIQSPSDPFASKTEVTVHINPAIVESTTIHPDAVALIGDKPLYILPSYQVGTKDGDITTYETSNVLTKDNACIWKWIGGEFGSWQVTGTGVFTYSSESADVIRRESTGVISMPLFLGDKLIDNRFTTTIQTLLKVPLSILTLNRETFTTWISPTEKWGGCPSATPGSYWLEGGGEHIFISPEGQGVAYYGIGNITVTSSHMVRPLAYDNHPKDTQYWILMALCSELNHSEVGTLYWVPDGTTSTTTVKEFVRVYYSLDGQVESFDLPKYRESKFVGFYRRNWPNPTIDLNQTTTTISDLEPYSVTVKIYDSCIVYSYLVRQIYYDEAGAKRTSGIIGRDIGIIDKETGKLSTFWIDNANESVILDKFPFFLQELPSTANRHYKTEALIGVHGKL